ncbi:MAG: sterol desaturase family protein [Alphaproteobacteria bacterium]
MIAPGLREVALALLVGGAGFAMLERLWPAVARHRSLAASRCDLAWWFFTPLVTKALTRLAIVIAVVAVVLASGRSPDRASLGAMLAPRESIARLPFILQLAGFLLVSDLAAYAMHRLFHHRPLWRFHAVHHSSTEVDWLSAVRIHPVNDALMRLAQAVPILSLGFDPALLAGWVPVLAFQSILVHANVPWDFGPLRWVIASPAFHRQHHALDDDGVGRNFAALFPFIDLAFGTFQLPAGEPERFGAPGADVPDDFAGQLAWPLRRSARPGSGLFARRPA